MFAEARQLVWIKDDPVGVPRVARVLKDPENTMPEQFLGAVSGDEDPRTPQRPARWTLTVAGLPG